MTGKTESKNNGGHFTAVPQEFTRCGTFLSLTEKAVMLYLYSNAKRFNIQGVTRPLIALKAGVSERAVTAALKTLMVKKVIDVCRKNVPGTKKSCLSITLLPFPEVPEQYANFAHANNAHANFAGANFAHIDPSCTVDPSSSTRSTSSTVDHSQRTTTAAPSAVSGGGASGGAGGAAEPDGDVLDDVYQEFAERHREGEFDRFLRYNRKTGWQMSAYDAAAEWLSKERPDRSRKPKAAGSGERLPESVAGAMEQVRAMCGRLAGVNEALARKAAGWFKLAGICCTANPGNTKAPAKLMESAREFLRRCPLFLDGEDAEFGEFVDSLVTK